MPKADTDYRLTRRDQILAAAARCFAADGFHRTSMQDVIAAAGVSPGGFYRYFRSKDEMIRAICLDAIGVVEELVLDALRTHQPIPELMAGLPRALAALDEADARTRLAVQAWGEVLRNPALSEAMTAGVTGLRTALRDRIAAGQRDGEIPAQLDPDACAGVLLAVVQGFILQHAWDPSVSAEGYGKAARDVVGGLLGSSAVGLPRASVRDADHRLPR
ncbi:TetR/AcrR family transcriptional regulator [Nocardia sp. CNY236]|uniref:TetR/AcrR family transcriptional regulator n=1 Tax=Nocardia sp. CNY236 TaxID=1169152 RepID=UPI0003FE2013|nr:TetR/AcrR family transcriptional regulator [Nocardia sp. CNY236]